VLVCSSRVPGESAVVSTAYRCICNSEGLPHLWTDAAVTSKFRELCRLHNTVAVYRLYGLHIIVPVILKSRQLYLLHIAVSNSADLPIVSTTYHCACNYVKICRF
jgi:hypothetical protein